MSDPAGEAGRAVTVVIPTRDRRRLLLRTLGTVRAQVEVAIRIVVVDDAGRDGSADAVRSLADDRIEIMRHDRSAGVSGARNAGVERVATPWVAFVDDDDLWAPDKLRTQLAALDDHPGAQWSCAGAIPVDAGGVPTGGHPPPAEADVLPRLLAVNVVPGGGSGLVVATDLVRSVGGFDSGLSNLADWDLAIRLALQSPCATVARPLVGYLVDPGGMAHDIHRSRRELRLLESRYADERRVRGVVFDWPAWLSYLAYLADNSGRRALSSRLHLEMLLRHRRVRSLGSIGLNLMPERVLRARLARAAPDMPAGWTEEARVWLPDPLMASDVGA